jgi:hypothetical protein
MSGEEFEEFIEIPDYVPDELVSEALLQSRMAELFGNGTSVKDFMELIGYLNEMPEEERNKLRESVASMVTELQMRSEKLDESGGPTDILFIGSNGRRVVKGLHYPREALGGDGPVILPTSTSHLILGAFSDEKVKSDADDIESQYDTYEEQSEAWERQMAEYAIIITDKFESEQPMGIDDFLRNIE